MFRVLECITNQHDHGLVLLAGCIWLLGSLAFFFLMDRSTACVEQRRRRWQLVAAIVAGFGVWATHFVAMLAYDGPLPFSFDPLITGASIVFVILGFGLTVQILGKAPSVARNILGAAVTTAGIAAMHFTGMEAIIARAGIRYDYGPIFASFLIVMLAFFIAYWQFSQRIGASRITIPALFAIFGVLALHFTGMSATTLIPDPTVPSTDIDRTPRWLIVAIIVGTFAMMVVVVASAIIDRLLTDLQGLTEAAMEGVAIINTGKIIEANRQLSKLLDADVESLIGSSPDHWLKTNDHKSLIEPRASNVEATLRYASKDRKDMVFEIGMREIEYRGKQCHVLAVRDLTARKLAERRVEHLAAHDTLTDLPNRAHLSAVLESLCNNDESFALHALDLDRFKAVNDVFGHAAGDIVLCRVANLLRGAMRHHDIVARMGGDEFLIVQRNIRDIRDAELLTQRILTAFQAEMDITRGPMAVGVSIGVAVYPNDATTPETLRHNADFALYRAKDGGRGIARFFDQDMDKAVRERRELEHDLRQAIARGQFRLMFQPHVSTATGDILGYEALLRWDHPARGPIAPSQFIPIAEDIGAIIPIGEWVLREACNVAAAWPDHLSIAVNVSAVQFQLPNLPAIVASALEDSRLPAHRLELEVTESVMLRDRDSTLDIMHKLKAIGVDIVMDDFGTGYSSLSNLQAFPFDKIKIDRSFVSQVTDDENARSILRAIVGLGRSLDLPVVAEGVETDAQRLIISNEGCPQAQGYFFGMPAAAIKDEPVPAANQYQNEDIILYPSSSNGGRYVQ